MQIKQAKISNYKSFKETPEIAFGSGFNVIVGQNNVGKTALIEAISLTFFGNPHKSIETKVGLINPASTIDISITLEKNELKDVLLRNIQEFYLPIGQLSGNSQESQRILDKILAAEIIEINFQVVAHEGSRGGAAVIESSIRKVCELPQAFPQNENCVSAHFRVTPDRTSFSYVGSISHALSNSVDQYLARILINNIYLFKAERLNIGICDSGVSQTLSANASNLPEVLHNLQSRNPRRFSRLIGYVRQIFPSINEVSVRPVQPNKLEIIIWTCDPKSEREDLTIPLSDSGTGVGQALAILYVAITSEYSRVIIIDEPNSFLHPGATRKLIEILKSFPQHQFIVTTHSPEVIRAANAEKINLIKWIPPQSQIEQLEGTLLQEISKCLAEVGAKLSDVFGADKILWVEGPTEETAFNQFVQKGLLNPKDSINIVAVKSTGEFQRKNKHLGLILDIYQKLSNGNALLPPAIGFIFDKEKLNETEIQDIKRRSKNLVSFLPRRMYENYLLHSEAITAVLNTLPSFAKNNLAREGVDEWIKGHGELYVDTPCAIDSPEWHICVDAARLLSGLFADISSGQEEFDKVKHSIEITDWLLNNQREKLGDLVEFLSTIIR